MSRSFNRKREKRGYKWRSIPVRKDANMRKKEWKRKTILPCTFTQFIKDFNKFQDNITEEKLREIEIKRNSEKPLQRSCVPLQRSCGLLFPF